MAELSWHGKTRYQANNLPDYGKNKLLAIETIGLSPGTEVSTSPTSPDPAWHNHLIHGDALQALPALLPTFADTLDLIYIDPPFMTGHTFKSGSQLAYSDKWGNDLDTYLSWLYEVFQWLHRLLAIDGCLYVHLDWRAAHYAKALLDEVFGSSLDANGPGFKNEIIWHYQSGGRSVRHYARKHDTILLYTKSGDYCFHPERIGERRGVHRRNHMRKAIGADGLMHWTIKSAGRIYSYSEHSLMTPSDVWSDINHLHQKHPERSGYATQKPAALLERIILASSEEDDLVLDCFCGSGVTPFVAQQLRRRWIACDRGDLAISLTRKRVLHQVHTYPLVLERLEPISDAPDSASSYDIIHEAT